MLYKIKIEDKEGNKIETTRHFTLKSSANEAIRELQRLFKGHNITVVKSDVLPHMPVTVDKITFKDPERETIAIQTVVRILESHREPVLKTWLRMRLELAKIPTRDINLVLNLKTPYWRVEKKDRFNATYYIRTNKPCPIL